MSMTNTERHNGLNKARESALYWATRAEGCSTRGDALDSIDRFEAIDTATMWAAVAQALKVGDAPHDNSGD